MQKEIIKTRNKTREICTKIFIWSISDTQVFNATLDQYDCCAQQKYFNIVFSLEEFQELHKN